jgi:hypothetical protein
MIPILLVLSDCIGSAFNAKGFMQCPNCREIEMGNWRYASGPRSTHDVSSDDSVLDEDLDLAPPRVFVVRHSKLCSYGDTYCCLSFVAPTHLSPWHFTSFTFLSFADKELFPCRYHE